MAAWSRLPVKEEMLEGLVGDGLPSPKEMVPWRAPVNEDFRNPHTDEVIVHVSFIERGLSLPALRVLPGDRATFPSVEISVLHHQAPAEQREAGSSQRHRDPAEAWC